MKVVILGSAHPLRGGLATYNERLAREYLSQGHEVIIYTFSLQYPNFLFPGITQYNDQAKPLDLDIRVKVNSVNPYNWWSVGNEISKLKPDLLLIKFWLPFMAPCLGVIARLVKRNGITKVFSIIDNIIPHEKRMGDFLLAKFFVNSIDAFIAQSKSVLLDLNLFDSSKSKLFNPHPLYDNFGELQSKSEAKSKLGLIEGERYILFFGFIRDYKGLDLILEAMALKEIKDISVKLIVAGEFYSDKQPYLDLIEKLKIHKSVILKADFIPDDKVASYFSAADLVVQPYKHATQSGVTQICYHFEKPMLVTNVGGLPEIVPHQKVGYVVDTNALSIAQAINDFYVNNREREFVNNTKIEKIKYSWATMLSSIQTLCEKV
jgi:glycosyltransferase involved in cell wall biosynthesis